jgi:hypothetical protein
MLRMEAEWRYLAEYALVVAAHYLWGKGNHSSKRVHLLRYA